MNATTLNSILREETNRAALLEETEKKIQRLDVPSLRRVLFVVLERLEPQAASLSLEDVLTGSQTLPNANVRDIQSATSRWAQVTRIVLTHNEGRGVTTADVAKELRITSQQAYNSLYVTEKRRHLVHHEKDTWYPTHG